MQCPNCGHESRPDRKFCTNCGAELLRVCPGCESPVEPDERFCGECGWQLTDPAAAVPPVPQEASTSSPSAPAPPSFANGRYEVKRFLGEGGKKQVYLAHDSLLDREVAFALIKTEGLDDVSRMRITREAQAMGRLGSHPHIVTVFDLGEHPSAETGQASQPYMVTELMGGGDVEGVIEDAADHRIPLEQAIGIAKETCRGLEFAHSRDIVHRDLKPGNVWLTADGTAKIGDFGLAVATDRSRLTMEGMMVGTVSYMPPEQAMGGEVTPRSDLYSLGAMLYEMVTGRPPFLGDDSVAIIGQHINTPPVAPTWHNPQCPRSLEALILRLLAKDPAERPESSADVLAALESLDLTVSADGAPSLDEAHALDSLAGGVFVGRQREMGELKAALEDALSGRGRLVTLVGEPGIGKTRTAQELATYAGLRGAQTLWGRCYEDQGVPPYWPWVQAIRSYVREKDPEQLRSEMGSGAAAISEVISEVRERLPGLETAPDIEPDQARFRLFDSICAFFKSAGRRQPLVLMLDDLHWADNPSLQLLEFVSRELSDARLLLVGTYRDVELSRQHPLAETLGELTRDRQFQRVLLRGLSHDDVARFVEVTSGLTPPRSMVDAVHQQTEGNPLFLTEVVRLLVQEGELTPERVRQRDSWSVRIPEGVREVIGRRLNRLSQRCNQTLGTASIIGREFGLEQLKPLIDDLSEDRLLEVLEEALAARVIEELPQSLARYQFTHALIQETLAGELTMTRRVRLHARIAETLEELYGDSADTHAAELAHHFAQAEASLGSEKLVYYSQLAGDKALASYAWEEALLHFGRGLDAKEGQPTDGDAAAMMFGLARAQMATAQRGQLIDAMDNLVQAFDYYVGAGEIEQAVAVVTFQFPGTGRFQDPRIPQRLAQALDLVPPQSRASGQLLAYHADVLRILGDHEGAREAHVRALAIARWEGDADLERLVLNGTASMAISYLQFPEVRENCLQAIELSKATGEILYQGMNHYRIAVAAISTGNPGEAITRAAEGVALLESARSLLHLVNALHSSVLAHALVGDWLSAYAILERALELSPADPPLLGLAMHLASDLGNLQQVEVYRDRLAEVMRNYRFSWGASHAVTSLEVPLTARITGALEGLELALASADSILSSDNMTPEQNGFAWLGLAVKAILEGDQEFAAEQYDRLLPYRGIVWPHSLTAVDRILGLISHSLGNLDTAMEHFEDCLAFCRKAGYRPELAWACCDYADTLLQRASAGSAAAHSGDREKAMSLLEESLAIATELDMRPLMERVLSRRGILEA
ncbi:MAG: protein kinase [Dehalococcoidia bacterium]